MIYLLAFGDMAKLKCYCPEPACRRSGKQPFKADTLRDLVDQIWTHATSLTETSLDNGGCVHWRLLRKDEEEAHIIEFVNKNAFTDDDEAFRTGFTRQAHPIGVAPRDRSRSPRVRSRWEDVEAAAQEVELAMDNFKRALAKARPRG